MFLRKNLALPCCVLLILFSLTACSKSSAVNESSKENAAQSTDGGTSANAKDSTTIYGKVTKIDENKITLALGSMPPGMGGRKAPDGNSGTAPSGMPDRPRNGSRPDRPSTGQKNGGSFDSGKTQVITIKDESLIKVVSKNQEKDGSLKDITKDCILTVQYSDSDKTAISKITVHKSGDFPSNNKGNAPASKNSDQM